MREGWGGLESAEDVRDDALDIGLRDAMIPNVVRKDHHVRSLRAEILAAGFADPNRSRQPQVLDACLQRCRNRLALPMRTANFVRLALVHAHKQNFLIRNFSLLHI